MSSVSALSSPPRHLCDFPFRLGPRDAESRSGTEFSQGGAWTLDDVLRALTNGARVFESRTGLRLRHAHCRPELAKALPFFAEEVRLWLELGLSDRPVPIDLRGWPPRARLYMAWIDAVLLPSGIAIERRPGERVVNPDAFRASLHGHLCRLPTSPDAARLLADLDALYRRYAPLCRRCVPPARPLRLAA